METDGPGSAVETRDPQSASAAERRPRAPLAVAFRRMPPGISALLLVEIALLGVPSITVPRNSLDSGWQFGVIEALSNGRAFGRDIIFTYGPWADLDIVTPVRFIFLVVGFLGALMTAILLVGVSWTVARAWMTPRGAAVLTLLTTVATIALGTAFSARVLVIAMIVLVGTVTGSLPESWRRWSFPTLAAIGGVTIESKFSNGVLVIATTAIAAALASPAPILRRFLRVLTTIGAALVSLVVFWLLAGQSFSDLPGWIARSIDVTSGYAEGMATEFGPTGEYVLFWITIGLLSLAVLHRQSRWALFRAALAVAWIALVGLRLGFTRHDSGHVLQTFGMLPAAFVAARAWKRFWLPAVGAALSTALAFAVASSGNYFNSLDPAVWGRNTVTLTTDLVSKKDRVASLESAYADVRNAVGLPAEILDAIQGRTVAIDPWDINVALAYNLAWQPVPVIQTYSAYTPRLDQINAQALASPDGPETILRRAWESIDGRNSLWESPSYMLTMLCQYRQAAQAGDWMVLEKTGSRCGAPAVLEAVPAQAGVPLPVPRPPDRYSIVVASLDLSQPFGERLRQVIFKPAREQYLGVDDTAYRIPRAHLSGPLLLSIPAAAGWPDSFGGGVSPATITPPQDGTVTFSVVTIDR